MSEYLPLSVRGVLRTAADYVGLVHADGRTAHLSSPAAQPTEVNLAVAYVALAKAVVAAEHYVPVRDEDAGALPVGTARLGATAVIPSEQGPVPAGDTVDDLPVAGQTGEPVPTPAQIEAERHAVTWQSWKEERRRAEAAEAELAQLRPIVRAVRASIEWDQRWYAAEDSDLAEAFNGFARAECDTVVRLVTALDEGEVADGA